MGASTVGGRRPAAGRRGWTGASRVGLVVALLGASAACGADAVRPAAASVEVSPGVELLVGVGDTARLEARVQDSARQELHDARVAWSSVDPSVVTVDATGLVRAVGAGTTTVVAAVEGVRGSAEVEVWLPETPAAWEPGARYFGRRNYVEYIPGTLPLVLSAPHGGSLEPSEIPDRSYGTTVTDSNTRELTLALRQAFLDQTGRAPHVVLSHLRRTKLDPNREVEEAAQGNVFAVQAWAEFQGFVEVARQTVLDAHDTGLYLDLHGHGHPEARAELGYLLTAEDLQLSDAALSAPIHAERSSIRALWHERDLSFADLVRGPSSLGAFFVAQGLRAVPGPDEPHPGREPYFSGGYNTDRHGSRADGVGVSGIQVEMPFPGWRDSEPAREATARKLARAVRAFLAEHYGHR